MVTSIVIGLIAAFLQSCSYLFSRRFILRFRNPLLLLFYSQMVMSVLALALMPLVTTSATWHSTRWIGPLVVCNCGALVGQVCFFRTLREIEASRLSSLLGLKLPVLAFLCFLYYGSVLNGWQWAAIVICAAAALMMNWSGVRISWRAGGWLFLCLIGYSVSDIGVRELVVTVGSGGGMVRDSLTAVALSYFFLGVMVLPMAWRLRFRRRLLMAAAPFGICWFVAMLFLFFCFGALGAVFGNILQSSRGMISVVLSLLLARAGYGMLEQSVPGSVWLRRGGAALLMAGGIVLFSWAHS